MKLLKSILLSIIICLAFGMLFYSYPFIIAKAFICIGVVLIVALVTYLIYEFI